MSVETICPCCGGSKGKWQHFEGETRAWEGWDHTDDETCECGPSFVACLACKGTGELVGLPRAILLARGDIAPVQRRGFA
jgi:hypothetical protein